MSEAFYYLENLSLSADKFPNNRSSTAAPDERSALSADFVTNRLYQETEHLATAACGTIELLCGTTRSPADQISRNVRPQLLREAFSQILFLFSVVEGTLLNN